MTILRLFQVKNLRQATYKRGVVWGLAGYFLCSAYPVSAVVFVTSGVYSPTRTVTMTVGSPDTTINKITFDVAGNNVNTTPVIGISDAPATSPAGGINIRMQETMPSPYIGATVSIRANSTAGLTCVANSGCGNTIIPFSDISWTAYKPGSGGLGMKNESFNNGSGQGLSIFIIYSSGGDDNIITFSYNNNKIYPAGQYTGRVIYTGTLQ